MAQLSEQEVGYLLSKRRLGRLVTLEPSGTACAAALGVVTGFSPTCRGPTAGMVVSSGAGWSGRASIGGGLPCAPQPARS